MSHRLFSMLELVTALAILAVLTALSMPKLYEFTLRSKTAELDPNVEGIWVSAIAFEAAADTWPPRAEWQPPLETMGRKPRTFTVVPGSGFEAMGWRPDGEVRGSYFFGEFPDSVVSDGYIDLDADGVSQFNAINFWKATSQTTRAEGCTPNASECW